VADEAATVHGSFVLDTLERTRTAVSKYRLPVDRYLACAPSSTLVFFKILEERHGVRLLDQVGDDLGARMHGVFDSLFARGYGRVMIVGTDVPSLPLERYSGVYQDSLYGSVTVRVEGQHLVLDMAPKMVGDMEHWHYDTFKVKWRDHRDGTNLVTFALDADGDIDTMSADIGGPTEERPRMKRVGDLPKATSTNTK